MERRSALYGFLVFGGLIALSFAFFFLLFSSMDQREPAWGGDGSGPRIGVVEITGVIRESKDVLGELHELRKDKKIKAIVVRVDSPGGAVAPSQEIYQAILRARKDKKVVCSMGTVAASGGYYISAACEKIVASAGTLTGSIGVISELPHIQGLLEVARVQVDTLKAGAMKDVGSPLRPMEAGERKFFQKLLDGIHEQFIDDVAQARKLDKNELRLVADGRVMTGKEALEAKLVDELGNLEHALEVAVQLSGEKGDPVPVFQKKPGKGLLSEMLSGLFDGAEPRGGIQARDPRL